MSAKRSNKKATKKDLMDVRLRLFEYAATHALEELLQKTLDELELLTQSLTGFYHFLGEDEKTLSLQAWSTRTIKEFCKAEGKGMHYSVNQAGVWVDCIHQRKPVIHNEYASLSHRKGLPEGHAPIVRELVVPIMKNDRIVAILGLGNKPGNYTQADIEIVSSIADVSWTIVEQKRLEEALRKSRRDLKISNEINRVFLFHPDDQMYAEILKLILEVMESRYGTFGYFNEDGNFVAPAVTRKLYWNKCNVPDKEIIFHKGSFGGICGKAVKEKKILIDNEGPFQAPKGHIPIKNNIVAPIVFHGEVISAIHLANKPNGYGDEEKAVLKSITDQIAPVLYARLQRDKLEKKRKEKDKALQESEIKFRTLVNQAPAALFLHDMDGRIVDVNQAALDNYGYTRKKLLLMKAGDIDPDYIEREDGGAFWKELNDLGKIEFEARHRRKNGSIFPVRVSLVPTMLKGKRHVFALAFDLTDQKHIQKKLHDSEEIFRTVFDQAAVGIAQVAPNGSFLQINTRFCQIIGYEKNELLDLSFRDITHPEDLQLDDAHVARIMSGEIESFEIEKRYIHKDGHFIWIRLYSNAVRDNKGNVKYAVAAITDISDRVKTLDALKESQQELQRGEKNYRLLVENQMNMVVKVDPEGRFLFVSPSYCKMFGKSEKELLGQHFMPLVHEQDRESTARAMEALYAPPYATYIEQRAKTKDGWRWLAWADSAVLDDEGNVREIIGVGRDISDRKNAERALWETTERFRKVFDSQTDAILVLDADVPAKIVECNAAVSSIFQYNSDEMIGKTIAMLHVDELHLKDFQNQLYASIEKNGYLIDFSFSMKRKDGTVFPSEHTVMELKDNTGKRTGWVSIVRDLTEKRQIEERLQQAQRMEAIGNLAGGIAHDFNNILFPIVGMSEILLEDLPPGSMERENAGEILSAGKRGGDLVKQILAFSRQVEHKMTPMRVQHILKEALKLTRATIPSYIEINQSIQNNCGLVMADPTQIHQVVMNIITNAYHAMEASGGILTVGLKEMELAGSDLNEIDLEPGRYAVLNISDTGCGMTKDLIDKIFDPYFTTKEQGKGTGLGLAVAYGIIKEHQGSIKVTSEIKKGSTFTVYLPLMTAQKEIENTNEIKKHPKGTERVLLVDDEESIAKLEKQMLERLGYQVTSYFNSIDAVEAFKSRPDSFDIVISDMTMPNIPGDDLAREIKKIKPDIPVILCTGFSERIDEKKAEHLGVAGILMKPVSRSDMADMVWKALDKAGKKNPVL